jgi:hypothetical protein
MSLFKCEGRQAGGKIKVRKVTAKTEAEASERFSKDHAIEAVFSIEKVPETKTPKVVRVPRTAEVVKPKTVIVMPAALTKMQKMLYLQHGRCFFCGEPLDASEASIEHLNPKARGGTSTEDNEVVCHATLNQTFGDMNLKQKFEFILRSTGPIKCPLGK